jgi:hypothetical protein
LSVGTYDAIIVGSGPAGVSAAFPLVLAGLNVLMVDGGRESDLAPPAKPFLAERFAGREQWKWMVGEDFYALQNIAAVSPKLRVPTHRYVFDRFLASNRIETNGFFAVGSLAQGGLSNSWGCGVACLSPRELCDFPFPTTGLGDAYAAVASRIGISGGTDDDLSDYFGLDAWATPPIAMDKLHEYLHRRYQSRRDDLMKQGFSLGRSRVAALSRDTDGRKACDLSGNCLWGCSRKALYSAAYDLPALREYGNFSYREGFIVETVAPVANGASIHGRDGTDSVSFHGRSVLLAAGTLATTRLALKMLDIRAPVAMQSCPTAAFLLWMPRMLGLPRSSGFGLGQLSFSLKLDDEHSGFGSTFSTTGIPVTEFLQHLPMSRRNGIVLLKHLLSSCVVGNFFLPGHLSESSTRLEANGSLRITGGYSDRVQPLMSVARTRLSGAFRKLGAWVLPGSFSVGIPGSDVHYACTLPMRTNPKVGETDVAGRLTGTEGVYVVDGACLPSLSEKSHTLTLMANADRIAKGLAERLSGEGYA